MSTLLLLTLQFAAPPPPALTVSSVTVPSYRLDCRLNGADERTRRVEFIQSGGRGYEDTRLNARQSRVRRTPIELRVGLDQTDLFSGYTSIDTASDDAARWQGVRRLEKRNKVIQLEAFPTRAKGRVAMIVQPDWPRGTVQLLGFCQVYETPQLPLNADETKKVLTK